MLIVFFSLFTFCAYSQNLQTLTPITNPSTEDVNKLSQQEILDLSLEDFTLALAKGQLVPLADDLSNVISNDPEVFAIALRKEQYQLSKAKELFTIQDKTQFDAIEAEIISLFY